MPGEFRCECGGRVAMPTGTSPVTVGCPGCGVAYTLSAGQSAEPWRHDPSVALALSSADGATKKPGPPPVGEPVWAPPSVTMDFYQKLANAPRRYSRRRWKRIRHALFGGAFLAAGAAIYQFKLDAGFLSLGTLSCVGAGLVYLFKAMLGKDR